MNGQLFFDTLMVWSAQICVLALAGVVTIRFLHQPKARLWAWQGLLLLLLALPLIEPWRVPLPEALPALIEDIGAGAGLRQALGPHAHHWSRADLLWVIALGAVLRLVWIGAGLLRLRYRYLRSETVIDFFGDAVNTRTNPRIAAILRGLDGLAVDSMERVLAARDRGATHTDLPGQGTRRIHLARQGQAVG